MYVSLTLFSYFSIHKKATTHAAHRREFIQRKFFHKTGGTFNPGWFSLQSPEIRQNSGGGISVSRFLVKSNVNITCHDPRNSNDIDMKQ